MEALDSITAVISTVGFPIAICLILLWYINKMTEAHKNEMDSMTSALNQNTVVLAELKELIRGLKKDEQ